MLERAIVKIGHLLALGLGEAGSLIIGSNMTYGGDMDPIIPGHKQHAIFGFCIIDSFLETTEALQTDIMAYVNKIAEITHSCVDKYGGSTNKNIGEAFLCVWKFYNSEEIADMDPLYNNKEIGKENQIIADLSVYSYLKVIAKLNKYDHILQYNDDPRLKKISDDFKVRMGFGLHQGWAIEGSIGSYFKIDASYLSPNVNMASRLEAATKQFGTEILISGALHDILSDPFQAIMIEIDTVTVKGSIQPIRLFTIDINIDDMVKTIDSLQFRMYKDKKSLRAKERKTLFDRLNSGATTSWIELSADEEFIELRKTYDPDYAELFDRSYRAYLAGDWSVAGPGFEQLVKLRPKDGPTKNLNKVINIQNSGKAPDDWKGYRSLTSK